MVSWVWEWKNLVELDVSSSNVISAPGQEPETATSESHLNLRPLVVELHIGQCEHKVLFWCQEWDKKIDNLLFLGACGDVLGLVITTPAGNYSGVSRKWLVNPRSSPVQHPVMCCILKIALWIKNTTLVLISGFEMLIVSVYCLGWGTGKQLSLFPDFMLSCTKELVL